MTLASPRRNARSYAAVGVMVGLAAPAGLALLRIVGHATPDGWAVLAIMAAIGAAALGVAGWMIGRRDDALLAKTQELVALTDRLQALSQTDGLTGIPNRRFFDERARQEARRASRYATPLSVVMLDLDLFKGLNDRMGHLSGDDVLRAVASILAAERRAGDVVARWGGEEFAAILPHTAPDAARAWAERVRARIETTIIATEAGPATITASFGVAGELAGGDAVEELIGAADAALYQAKRLGRNRVVAFEDIAPTRAALVEGGQAR